MRASLRIEFYTHLKLSGNSENIENNQIISDSNTFPTFPMFPIFIHN